jgi:hypothetical protein
LDPSFNFFVKKGMKFISESLKQLVQRAHPPSDFAPQFVNGFWRSPKYSLRRQADMRKAARILQVEMIGLPEESTRKPLRVKPPKGTKYQRNYQERMAKIDKALQDMPNKVAQWKKVHIYM